MRVDARKPGCIACFPHVGAHDGAINGPSPAVDPGFAKVVANGTAIHAVPADHHRWSSSP